MRTQSCGTFDFASHQALKTRKPSRQRSLNIQQCPGDSGRNGFPSPVTWIAKVSPTEIKRVALRFAKGTAAAWRNPPQRAVGHGKQRGSAVLTNRLGRHNAAQTGGVKSGSIFRHDHLRLSNEIQLAKSGKNLTQARSFEVNQVQSTRAGQHYSRRWIIASVRYRRGSQRRKMPSCASCVTGAKRAIRP